MKRPMKVADIMHPKRPGSMTIKPTETIAALARRLQQERVGALIVSDDGCTVDGIISERDVAYALPLHRGDLHALPVAALMTKHAITCSREDTIAEVAVIMAQRHIRHLPVTDGKELIGIVSMRDIFMHRLDEMQRVARLLGSTVGVD